ncbi:hypothetical protein F5050DRAFT_1804354 [Lentinula boryana]|uniref:F-box domain-containing protein n=1 Tax=Lentinula boryana TaxID=40481 RepID=A0ABQ8QP21_9AGAR|nr:hypothetical protein F5050DRAFT_1804354 [Lentinula boryana]
MNIISQQLKGLEVLPLDVLLELITFLPVFDALSLVSTSQKLHTLRSNRSFWHILIQTLRRSSVPLACPLHAELTQNLEILTLRTLQRQQTILSPSPSPIRVRNYLGYLRGVESISTISGTHLYLTCDLKDGMARCWDLTNGNALAEIYVGRNILAKSTLSTEKGKFLICLLVAETTREFVATSVVVLCLDYLTSIDNSVPDSYSNVHLSILHRSALDATYPAMYPSCAMNEQGLVVIAKMATFIHLIAINLNTGLKAILETDLTEMEVDFVDLSFRGQDLIITTSSTRSSGMYTCSRDNLPYSSDPNVTTYRQHLNLLPFSVNIPFSATVLSYERCGFYPSGGRTSNGSIGTITEMPSKNSFATTTHYAITYEKQGTEHYTECCFWHLDAPHAGEVTPTEPVHQCRLPGLQFFEVPCAGSESGAWGAFVCDVDLDIDVDVDDFGHDFEVDVDVSNITAASAVRDAETDDSKAEIFLVHYDVFTRTSSVHRPLLPESLPGSCDWREVSSRSWVNNIKSIEFDERLGILYLMVDGLEGGMLCGLEFI